MITPFEIKCRALYLNPYTPKVWSDADNRHVEDTVNGKYMGTLIVDEETKDGMQTLFTDECLWKQDELIEQNEKLEGKLSIASFFIDSSDTDNIAPGMFGLKTKTPCTYKDGTERMIGLYDSLGNNMSDKKIMIGNGTEMKVKISPWAYYMAATKSIGITCPILEIMILDLVKHEQKSSLAPVEGGFVLPAE